VFEKFSKNPENGSFQKNPSIKKETYKLS
jgi:hypothetical protein